MKTAYMNIFFRSKRCMSSIDPGLYFISNISSTNCDLACALVLLYQSFYCCSFLSLGKILASLLTPRMKSVMGPCDGNMFVGGMVFFVLCNQMCYMIYGIFQILLLLLSAIF